MDCRETVKDAFRSHFDALRAIYVGKAAPTFRGYGAEQECRAIKHDKSGQDAIIQIRNRVPLDRGALTRRTLASVHIIFQSSE